MTGGFDANAAQLQWKRWGGQWRTSSGESGAMDIQLTIAGSEVKGTGSDSVGTFKLDGRYDSESGDVKMNKTYHEGETMLHTLRYEGHMVGGRRIVGTWKQVDVESHVGPFQLWDVQAASEPLPSPRPVRWRGFWRMSDGVQGDMELQFGITPEGEVKGEGEDSVGAFSIVGAHNPGTGVVRMYKNYHGAHSLLYEGELAGDGRITGQWSQVGYSDNNGPFELWEATREGPLAAIQRACKCMSA
eukprot:tig00021127_g18682.t1